MHKELKRFHLSAEIADDKYFIQQRDTQEKNLIDLMRDGGYVPVLGLGPFWSTELNEKGTYNSLLSMYGIYVGKRKSWEIMGVDVYGTSFPISLPKSKLNQS